MTPKPEPPDEAPRWAFWAALAFTLAVVGWRYATTLAWAWPVHVDDAFISFRYARNLVEGFGLRWNPGEAPVEGYSNFLWVLLLAAAQALGFEPLPAARLLGLAASLGGLGAIGWLTWLATRCRFSALAAALMLGVSQDWIVSAVLGLETCLYVLLVALALALVLRAIDRPSTGRAVGAGLLCAACALTRPDGAAVFVAAVGWAAFAARKALPRRAALAFLAAFAAVLGPFLVFRLAYFGDLVPNAVRAKDAAQPFVARYLETFPYYRGAEYLADGLRSYAPCLFLAAATLVVVGREALVRLTLPALVGLAYVVGLSQTWPVVGVAHRLMLPVALALMVLAAPGLVALLRRARSPLGALVAVGVAVMGLRFLAAEELPPFAENPSGSQKAGLLRTAAQLSGLHAPFGAALARFPPITIAMTDCGIVPFVSRQNTIDLFGLNDRHLATHGPDVEYVLGRRPELIALMSRAEDHFEGSYEWEHAFWDNPHFLRDYVRYQVRLGLPYHFVLFRRRDFVPPDAPARRPEAPPESAPPPPLGLPQPP